MDSSNVINGHGGSTPANCGNPTASQDDAAEENSSSDTLTGPQNAIATVLSQFASTASNQPNIRADLRGKPVTEENAQSIFPSRAVLFCGNLDKRKTDAALKGFLYDSFSRYGPCYITVSRTNDMPGGHIQFETEKVAEHALNESRKREFSFGGRQLRVEEGRTFKDDTRTVHIGYFDGRLITISEVRHLLFDLGSCIDLKIFRGRDLFGHHTDYGQAVFERWGDLENAERVFRINKEVYLRRIMESRPNNSNNGNNGNNPQWRGWNPNPRGNSNRRAGRTWVNGNGHGGNGHGGNGHGGNGHGGNGIGPHPNGNGANNGRGGYRNGPGNRGSFSTQHTSTSSFSGQTFPSPNSPAQHYNPGNQFASGFGGNNFNQGYNPNAAQPFGNFPQVHPGNLPQNYSQGYPSIGVIPGGPIYYTPGPECPPPFEFPVMQNPGFPVFMQPVPYTQAPVSPVMPQPSSPPGLLRRPLRPNEPLIVSSQPQYDTDRHRELYYYPPNQETPGMSPGWVDPAPGYCMQPDYNQHPLIAEHQSNQSSVDLSYSGGFAGERASDQLTQTRVGSDDSQDSDRGRTIVRDSHSTTDGGFDAPPVMPRSRSLVGPGTGTDDTPRKISLSDARKLIESHLEPDHTSNEPIEPENNPKDPQPEPKLESEQMETTPAEYVDETIHYNTEVECMDESFSRAGAGAETAGAQVGETEQLTLEITSLSSTMTSDEAAGPHTPQTDDEACQGVTAINLTTHEESESTLTEVEPESSTPVGAGGETDHGDKQDKGKAPAQPDVNAQLALSRGIRTVATSSLPRRSRPKHRKLKPKYQPKTDTGKTVEQYTRETYAEMVAKDPSFKLRDERIVDEVIQELEDETRKKSREQSGLDPDYESGDDADVSTN